jgi:predicted GIY-YIG superfamily endonuclease
MNKEELVDNFFNQIEIPKLDNENFFYIYILRLEENKYYIGKTKNLRKRIEDHLSNCGSIWTSNFKPIYFEKIIKSDDNFDEDKYVKKYMSQKGINNVRGGTYSTVELDLSELKILRKEIIHSNGRCYNCLERHFYSVKLFLF